MTVERWLQTATEDARRRGLADLPVLLETLAAATASLRAADWNDAADGRRPGGEDPA